MTAISAVVGDITTQDVDAIVNPTNTEMRPGGGVDRAIHDAAGPGLLEEVRSRFPTGLAVGDAGWTHGGRLAARYVIHTVGPLQPTSKKSEQLLASCYRRCLQIADELGIQTIAFPVIGVGSYGWPGNKAIPIEARTLMESPPSVSRIMIIASDEVIRDQVLACLINKAWLRLLQGVRVLHERGFEGVRVWAGFGPVGGWRIQITDVDYMKKLPDSEIYIAREYRSDRVYWNRWGAQVGKTLITNLTTPGEVADLLLGEVPYLAQKKSDPEYVVWYQALVSVCEGLEAQPWTSSDWVTPPGWGIGQKVVFPYPPAPKG